MSSIRPDRHGGTTTDSAGSEPPSATIDAELPSAAPADDIEIVPDDPPVARRAPAAEIGRAVTTGEVLPGWFSGGVYALVVWCAAAGITALVLLTKNAYSPTVCAVVATAATAAALRFRPRRDPELRPAHGPAIAAVAIALLLLALAGIWHSEHLLTDRDPAVYVNTGRSIARTHMIHPAVPVTPFNDTRNFSTHAAGFQVARNTLFPNFLDFLPALLALGWSVGGDTGLLLVPALIGAARDAGPVRARRARSSVPAGRSSVRRC